MNLEQKVATVTGGTRGIGPKDCRLCRTAGRLGTPEDIAGVVAFLCGNDGRWITGQDIVASGGA